MLTNIPLMYSMLGFAGTGGEGDSLRVWQTSNSLIGEVVSTTTMECRTLPLCESDTVLFGLSRPVNLIIMQGYLDIFPHQYWTSKQ